MVTRLHSTGAAAKPASQARAPAKRKPRALAAPLALEPSGERRYDVVLYGASGFVGRQTVAYFAALPANAGPGGRPLRWAIAGRSADKLEAVKQSCGAGAQDADVVVADAQDTVALADLARNSSVVLSSAGPFALYGSELVAACALHGTHYVDITGETPWVHDMIAAHQDAAVASGARIIPFCGFDSVPSDMGSYLVAQTMLAQHGEACQSVKACFSMRGGINGGTIASALNFMGEGKAKLMANPFLLSPGAAASRRLSDHKDPSMPVYDFDLKAWLGPFVMGPINTRVVRRSAELLTPISKATKANKASAYAPDFSYQEYMRFGGGPLAAAAATAFCAGMAASQVAMTLSPVRALANRFAPGPGTGPSERSMNNGSFRCELVGTSASGKVVRGRVADKGDPGNRATTKMVCEAALCLASQLDDLPGGRKHGGFLTPASGLGDVLLARLRAAGMTLEAH
jgi:short subunit dehydrogenase-like uncharacterized protein